MSLQAGTLVIVAELRHAAVVLAGPFTGPSGREYLIAPVYDGSEPGFAWTDADFRVAAEESTQNRSLFIALWNARPSLEESFTESVGEIDSHVADLIADSYWATLADDALPEESRLGKPVHAWKPWQRKVIRFQECELDRWQSVSSRVYTPGSITLANDLAREFRLFADIGTIKLNVDGLLIEYTSREILEATAALRDAAPGVRNVVLDLTAGVPVAFPVGAAEAQKGGVVAQATGEDVERAAPAVWRRHSPETQSVGSVDAVRRYG